MIGRRSESVARLFARQSPLSYHGRVIAPRFAYYVRTKWPAHSVKKGVCVTRQFADYIGGRARLTSKQTATGTENSGGNLSRRVTRVRVISRTRQREAATNVLSRNSFWWLCEEFTHTHTHTYTSLGRRAYPAKCVCFFFFPIFIRRDDGVSSYIIHVTTSVVPPTSERRMNYADIMKLCERRENARTIRLIRHGPCDIWTAADTPARGREIRTDEKRVSIDL